MRREHGYKLALTAVSSASQYWQDSNLGTTGVPTKIPAYNVWSLAANLPLGEHMELLGGIANLTDRTYYSRVWLSGIEPAQGRTWYAGVKAML